MKKVISVLVLAGALVGPLAASAVPASAASTACVTRREYRRVDVGMRKARVRNIFDTSGKRIDYQGNWEEYAYPACTGAVVFVEYVVNRVTVKDWVRGE